MLSLEGFQKRENSKKGPLPFLKDFYFQTGFQSQIFNYLELLSSFLFYTFILPFKIVLSKDGTVRFEENKIQKGICILLHLDGWLRRYCSVADSINHKLKIDENPVEIWLLALKLGECFEKVVIMLLAWYKPYRRKVLKLYEVGYNLIEPGGSTHVKELLAVSCFFVISMIPWFINGFMKATWPVFTIFFGDNPSVDMVNGGYTPVGSLLKCFYRREWAATLTSTLPTWGIYFLHGLLSLSPLHDVVFQMAGIFISYFLTLVAYKLGSDFERFLKNRDGFFTEVMEGYEGVKRFIYCTNEIAGTLWFLVIFRGLVGSSSHIFKALKMTTVYEGKVQMIVNLAAFSCSVYIAAEANSKFEKINEYVFLNRKAPGQNLNKVLLLLNDVGRERFGVKAFIFPITYSFIATIFSSVLTYTIILLQFPAAFPTVPTPTPTSVVLELTNKTF